MGEVPSCRRSRLISSADVPRLFMEKRRRRQTTGRTRPKAATGDILTGVAAMPRIKAKWHRYYNRLMQLLDFIRQRKNELNRDALDSPPHFSTHMADAATDTYDRDLVLSLLSSEQDAVYEIEDALSRIRDGTYGVCELTGKPIEPERLEVIPWTRFSATAEKQLEREGTLKRARLGSREGVARVSSVAEQAND
jgi:RNA polymerase-binding transcription factor DksA